MSIKPQPMFNVRYHAVGEKQLLVQRNNAYEIGQVGLTIWEYCDGNNTIEDIAAILTQEYDVEFDQALLDCLEFVNDLKDKGLLQW